MLCSFLPSLHLPSLSHPFSPQSPPPCHMLLSSLGLESSQGVQGFVLGCCVGVLDRFGKQRCCSQTNCGDVSGSLLCTSLAIAKQAFPKRLRTEFVQARIVFIVNPVARNVDVVKGSAPDFPVGVGQTIHPRQLFSFLDSGGLVGHCALV